MPGTISETRAAELLRRYRKQLERFSFIVPSEVRTQWKGRAEADMEYVAARSTARVDERLSEVIQANLSRGALLRWDKMRDEVLEHLLLPAEAVWAASFCLCHIVVFYCKLRRPRPDRDPFWQMRIRSGADRDFTVTLFDGKIFVEVTKKTGRKDFYGADIYETVSYVRWCSLVALVRFMVREVTYAVRAKSRILDNGRYLCWDYPDIPD